jgi:hypothetical protein
MRLAIRAVTLAILAAPLVSIVTSPSASFEIVARDAARLPDPSESLCRHWSRATRER